MSVVVVTAFPVPERRAEVIAAFETAIARVHGEAPALNSAHTSGERSQFRRSVVCPERGVR
jgi:hypothetical protein